MSPHRLLALAFVLALPACGTATSTSCPTLWTLGPQSTTVTEADDLLTLDAPASSPWPAGVSVTQPGLAGDFALAAQVQAFTTTASDGELSISVEAAAQVPRLTGSILGDRLQATLQPLTGDIQTETHTISAAQVTGAVAFSRQGSTVTVTIVGGGQTVTLSGDLGTGPLVLEINAIRPSAGGDTKVQISNVSVTDVAGAIKGDTFHCDSLGE